MKFAPILALIACLVFCAGVQAQQFPANATPVLTAGAPTNGTNEVQTLTLGGTPTGGTFKIAFDGFTTSAITWTATDATLVTRIQTALDALNNLEDGEVTVAAGTVSSGIGTITLTFGGNRAHLAVNLMTVANNSLTGTSPTAAIAETTPGVTASGRSSAKGRLLIDGTNGALYQNTGAPLSPVWSVRGTLTPTAAVADLSAVTQDSLTDSTGGTSGTTLAATTGIQTIPIPIQLASMTTAAADLVTAYTPGYKFKILSVTFATTTIGAGSGASQTLNLAIGSTALTGGVVVPTLSSTDTLGKLTAGTAVTAANTGTASDTISVKVAASGTVFTGGAGVLLVKLANMDTVDSVASVAAELAKVKTDNAAQTAKVNDLLAKLRAGGLVTP